MNRILLIYPPGKAYQRGEDRAQCSIEDSAVVTIHACNDLGYAAAVLRNKQYEVLLRDYQTEQTSFDAIEAEIKTFLPDVILISTTNATILSDIAFVAWVKEFHSCQFIIKGAIFFDIAQELLETLDLKHVDYLIGGEIDTVIGELADGIFQKRELDDIPGILYKKQEGWVKNAFDTWCCDLDSIPFPARDLMKNELYIRPDTGKPMATIQVSRGCPSNCTYCLTPIISGKKLRKRSVENIFAEVEECYYQYGISDFFFKADTYNFCHI